MAHPMTATIAEQRQLLVSRFELVSGITNIYDRWPNTQPNTPCVIVGSPDVAFRSELGGNFHKSTWSIYVLGGAVERNLEAGQDLIDELMAADGAKSVRHVVADPLAAAGADLWVDVTGWEDYGTHTINDIDYVGAVLKVEITYGPDDLDLAL